MSKVTMKMWARNVAKTAIAAFAGAIVAGVGGGQAASAIGHPIDWQAQLCVAGVAAVIAVSAYLKKQPLWDA